VGSSADEESLRKTEKEAIHSRNYMLSIAEVKTVAVNVVLGVMTAAL